VPTHLAVSLSLIEDKVDCVFEAFVASLPDPEATSPLRLF
jgi:hypothetical protein